MHKLLGGYFLGELNKSELKTKYLTAFQTEVVGKAPSSSVFENYFQQGANYLPNVGSFMDKDSYKIIGVEDKFDFQIDKFEFVGYVDLLIECEGGLIIVDHKSGALKPTSGRKIPTAYDTAREAKLRQLYLYAEAVKQRYGEYPKKLLFNCFRTSQVIEEDFSEKKLAASQIWATSTIDAISKEGDWRPEVNLFKCKYICDLIDCPYRAFI